jgi:hypothetical protein
MNFRENARGVSTHKRTCMTFVRLRMRWIDNVAARHTCTIEIRVIFHFLQDFRESFHARGMCEVFLI